MILVQWTVRKMFYGNEKWGITINDFQHKDFAPTNKLLISFKTFHSQVQKQYILPTF